ncbi:MAG TPA: sulfatase-like hydrolase/transferase [Pyrinomonadaceae bacterium]|jgi:hypothetical protein|nr:sulfatase-like hydrolase/transferase [Pyrinomonadaceae bacterium]
MLRDFIIALSLSNLCFYRAWRLLLNPAYYYFPRSRLIELAAITLNVALVAALLFAGITLARRSGKPLVRGLAQVAFMLALLLPLNGLRGESALFTRARLEALSGKVGLLVLGVSLLLLVAFALVRWRQQMFRAAVALVLVLAPFVLITFAQGVWLALRNNPAATARTGDLSSLPHDERTTRSPRVVWILFDEFDQRLAFDERPASVLLPEFDRLRNESFVAAQAYAAAGETMKAVPSLLTGKLICRTKVLGPDKLRIRYQESGEVAEFTAEPNIFTRARDAGVRSALAGWYHPYCRLLGRSLLSCYTERADSLAKQKLTVAGSMLQQLGESVSPLPLVARFVPANERLVRRTQSAEYSNLLEEAERLTSDARVRLVLIHLPVPHPPGIYDRTKQEFSDDAQRSYLDNLALADRALGTLRRALEDAGLWEETTLLVSSDHWWRVPNVWKKESAFWTREDAAAWSGQTNHRIPFILKLAAHADAATYDAPFNTVLTQDLLLAVLRGELHDAPTVAAWLDRHRSIADSPCNK